MIGLGNTVRELILRLYIEASSSEDADVVLICKEALGYLDHIVPLHREQQQDLAIRKCLSIIAE